MMTPQELLLAAADDQALYGHTKGVYYKDAPVGDPRCYTAPACAFGSLTRVTAADSNNHLGRHSYAVTNSPAAQLLAARIRNEYPVAADVDHPFDVITWFNDRPETTSADVQRVMVEAAGGRPKAADIGTETETVEFEPLPESTPVETPVEAPAEPVPA